MVERKQVDVDDLVIDTAQSRQGEWSSDDQDRQLRESIKETGVMTALLVRPIEMTPYGADADAEYAIIAGSRRYHAAVEAGERELPCKIIRANDFEAAVKSYKENEERKDLTDEERARSMKMQYEMIKPDPPAEGEPWVCSNCNDEFDSANGLDYHLTMSDCEKKAEHKKVPAAQTPRQARRWLAEKHYAEMENTQHAIAKVKKQIGMAELPEEVRVLLKSPGDRTDAEMKQLKNYGISATRDFSSRDGSEISSVAASVVDLHEEVNAADGVDATDAVLRAVGDLDFNQSNSELMREIQTVKSEVSEQFSDAESAEERQRAFRETLNDRQQQLRELEDSVGIDEIGTFNFKFEDQRYKRYHALAKKQQKTDSNAEIIRSGYQQYLEQQAEQNGW
jgi:hypothetical protein